MAENLLVGLDGDRLPEVFADIRRDLFVINIENRLLRGDKRICKEDGVVGDALGQCKRRPRKCKV